MYIWIQTNANRLKTHDSFTFEAACLNKKRNCMCEEQVSVNRFSPENPLCSSRPNQRKSCAAPPSPGPCMKKVRDFFADFARAGKGFTEILKMPPFRLIWPRQTISNKKSQNGGWQAGAWTRTASKTPGRGSPDHWSPSTSPPPSEAGWSAAKSASASAKSSSKNL